MEEVIQILWTTVHFSIFIVLLLPTPSIFTIPNPVQQLTKGQVPAWFQVFISNWFSPLFSLYYWLQTKPNNDNNPLKNLNNTLTVYLLNAKLDLSMKRSLICCDYSTTNMERRNVFYFKCLQLVNSICSEGCKNWVKYSPLFSEEIRFRKWLCFS